MDRYFPSEFLPFFFLWLRLFFVFIPAASEPASQPSCLILSLVRGDQLIQQLAQLFEIKAFMRICTRIYSSDLRLGNTYIRRHVLLHTHTYYVHTYLSAHLVSLLAVYSITQLAHWHRKRREKRIYDSVYVCFFYLSYSSLAQLMRPRTRSYACANARDCAEATTQLDKYTAVSLWCHQVQGLHATAMRD